MNETDIRKYAGLMQELGLTGLEITEGDRVVRLEKNAPAPARETIVVDAGTVPAASTAEAAVPKTEENADYISVNADPYVSMGDQVKTGQVLCVIEAMKLMNEIPAEVDGTVLEICVTNGQMVEFGTELFRIRNR